tara:strand:+ start:177 stop:488 length:312 start_codon:yes stop_codon:yes gene_type:complete
MSIFPKKKISPGDLVIGVSKYGWDNKGAPTLERYFSEPALVLEIEGADALIHFEHSEPRWYNLSKLERVYVTEEFTDDDRRGLAPIEFNNSDFPGDKNDDRNR